MPQATDHLLLFTRYPQPGQSKTRLIPCLGARGAAELQRRMTEQLMAQLRELPVGRIGITIHYEGGDSEAMGKWLGSFAYERQAQGSLGARLRQAFALAFAAGARRAVVIGSDCPALTSAHILAAFAGLTKHELVLGPATDGGYYLLGLRRPEAELFAAMPWGREELLARTVEKATALKLATLFLEPLSDVDRPEDLHHFRYHPHP